VLRRPVGSWELLPCAVSEGTAAPAHTLPGEPAVRGRAGGLPHPLITGSRLPTTCQPQALGPAEVKGGRSAQGGLRRRSVQVCDVHRRLQDVSLEVRRRARAATALCSGRLQGRCAPRL
jgi:hypothetical protein